MGKVYIHGGIETHIMSVISSKLVPSATTNYDIRPPQLPPGAYKMIISVASSVSGTTPVKIGPVTPFVEDGTQLAATPIVFYESNDVAGITSISPSTGADGHILRAGGIEGASVPQSDTVVLSHGLRIVVTPNESLATQKLDITLSYSRDV